MELSTNFARSLRLNSLNFSIDNDYVNFGNSKGRNFYANSFIDGKRESTMITADSDAEVLRQFEAFLPAGMLMRMLCEDPDKTSWFYLGMADRLRRAYIEPDQVQVKYEKPLKEEAKKLVQATLDALGFEPLKITVRRAITSASYSPIVGEADVTLPYSGKARRVQLVMDPSPLSDSAWALRINAYGLTPSETAGLHKAFPEVFDSLKARGYTVGPMPWIGQSY